MDGEATLAKQLEMTDGTWAALNEHGVVEGDVRAVDFTFIAYRQSDADALATELRSRGAEAQVQSGRAGWLRLRRSWTITGSSAPFALSLQSLRAWVTEMTRLGGSHASEFDGWGMPI